MAKLLRSFGAVLAGLLIGSVVNMSLIIVGQMVVPPPPGLILDNFEAFRAAMPAMGAEHFVFPFLAHAFGTLAGAIAATLIARRRNRGPALIVGAFFLVGGITNVLLLPAPLWFEALDLSLAYLPMALMGWWLLRRSGPAGS